MVAHLWLLIFKQGLVKEVKKQERNCDFSVGEILTLSSKQKEKINVSPILLGLTFPGLRDISSIFLCPCHEEGDLADLIIKFSSSVYISFTGFHYPSLPSSFLQNAGSWSPNCCACLGFTFLSLVVPPLLYYAAFLLLKPFFK